MSTALQLEVSLAVYGKWIIHLPFLQKGEPNAIVAVLSRVEPRLFAPKEVPEQRQFYFVHSGVVLYAARVLTAGTAWGEDFILESKCFFSGYVAYAMTHVEVYKLTRPQMLEAIATFPVALRAMRKQALLVALRHAMVSSQLQPRRMVAAWLAKRFSGSSDLCHLVPFADESHQSASCRRIEGKVNVVVKRRTRFRQCNAQRRCET
jgi:hypothetical protein